MTTRTHSGLAPNTISDRDFGYVEPPTIPAGMTMDEYRSKGAGRTVVVTLKVTDQSLMRAMGLIGRLLSRRTIEILSMEEVD